MYFVKHGPVRIKGLWIHELSLKMKDQSHKIISRALYIEVRHIIKL